MADQIKNYMEICVQESLDDIASKISFCTCDNCTADIKAIALNSLPTKYVATKKGHMYTKLQTLQQQFEVDVIAAIIKAIDIVKKNPRHEEE